MKNSIYTLTFLFLISCNQSTPDPTPRPATASTNQEDTAIIEPDTVAIGAEEALTDDEAGFDTTEFRRKSLESSYENATLFDMADTIRADFNGDGEMDEAIYIKEDETSGILIIHGGTNEQVRIGFGEQFAHMTEFDWVNYWGLVEDEITSENLFTEDGDILGMREVKLQNPSISLDADEIGGGLITFLDGKYVWIHQTC